MRNSSIPLILTDEHARVRLPEGTFSQPETVLRMVEVVGRGFFVALVASDSFEDRQPRTLIMSWDSDVVGFIESPKMDARLLQLEHFSATEEDGQLRLRHRQVLAISRGVDTAAGDAEVIMFLASDGSCFCGQEAVSPPRSIKVGSLIANVGNQSGTDTRHRQPNGGVA